MATVGWLSASAADVPAGDDWLGPRERAVLAGLRVEKRRADWRLGRWTVKAAVGSDVEVLAAGDGAPEVWLPSGERAPWSISLSHRDGRALVAVADPGIAVGCDLELVEPRSDAFVRDFLAAPEQALVFARSGGERALAANRAWTAKEAAAKVRREGLRLDVRHAVSRVDGSAAAAGGWHEVVVDWPDGPATRGWWRAEPGWVMTIASAPASPPPVALQNSGWRWPSSSV